MIRYLMGPGDAAAFAGIFGDDPPAGGKPGGGENVNTELLLPLLLGV